jgi:sugar lactone lactonase YvrE
MDDVDVLAEAGAQLGEGALWDVRTERIAWVDILGRRIHQTDPADGATESFEVALDVGTIAPRTAGGFVAALQDGFWVVGDGPTRKIAGVPEARPGLRFNDGKCDPGGRFWAGTMAYDEAAGAACLYRLDPTGEVSRVLDDVTISNGMAWSDDRSTMFYIDTPTRRIDAFTYDVDTGSITDRRAVVQIPPDLGSPDGMTIDAEGGLWVALWGGSAVHRYVDGRLDQVFPLPVSQPTSCAFGGPDLDQLFVTSAWAGLSVEERRTQPLAGSLFRLRPGVRGVLPFTYAGA